MPVGIEEYQDSDGNWHEITLYEPGTFDFEPLEVQLGDGSWGVPFLQESGADTPFEIQDSSGDWWGINKVGYVSIDSFEYPNDEFFNKYTTPSTSDTKGTMVYGNAVDGDRVYWSESPSQNWSVPQMGTLNAYPEAGSRFVYHIRFANQQNEQLHLYFGGQDNTIYGGRPQNTYEIRMNTADGAMFLTYNPSGSSYTTIASTIEDGSGTVNYQNHVWYAVMVDWYSQSHDGRTGARISLYDTTMPDPNSDTPITSFDTANFPESDYSGSVPQEEGLIGYRGGNHDVRIDHVVKYPPR